MIDPLETVIQYLKVAGLSTTQIASKHRYGSGWAVGSLGIVVNLDDGTPDIDVPVQNVRLEVRCFASHRINALMLLHELDEISRSTDRIAVTVSNGAALLYYFTQASGPSTLYDPDVKMDFALRFFEAKICEQGV